MNRVQARNASMISGRSLRLCRLQSLAPGSAAGFDPQASGEDTILVLRWGEQVLAYVNRCPHQGARLEYCKDRFLSADGRHIVCHAHGARFDPQTGRGTLGAGLGQALQPVACHIEDGWVWLAPDQLPGQIIAGELTCPTT